MSEERAPYGAGEEASGGQYVLQHYWKRGKTLTGSLILDRDGERALFKAVRSRHHLAAFGGWAVNRTHAVAAAEDGAVRVVLRDEQGKTYRCPMATVLASRELPQLGRVRDRQLLIRDRDWDTDAKGVQQPLPWL